MAYGGWEEISTDLPPRFGELLERGAQSNLLNICWSFTRISALGRRFPLMTLDKCAGSIPASASSFLRLIFLFLDGSLPSRKGFGSLFLRFFKSDYRRLSETLS